MFSKVPNHKDETSHRLLIDNNLFATKHEVNKLAIELHGVTADYLPWCTSRDLEEKAIQLRYINNADNKQLREFYQGVSFILNKVFSQAINNPSELMATDKAEEFLESSHKLSPYLNAIANLPPNIIGLSTGVGIATAGADTRLERVKYKHSAVVQGFIPDGKVSTMNIITDKIARLLTLGLKDDIAALEHGPVTISSAGTGISAVLALSTDSKLDALHGFWQHIKGIFHHEKTVSTPYQLGVAYASHVIKQIMHEKDYFKVSDFKLDSPDEFELKGLVIILKSFSNNDSDFEKAITFIQKINQSVSAITRTEPSMSAGAIAAISLLPSSTGAAKDDNTTISSAAPMSQTMRLTASELNLYLQQSIDFKTAVTIMMGLAITHNHSRSMISKSPVCCGIFSCCISIEAALRGKLNGISDRVTGTRMFHVLRDLGLDNESAIIELTKKLKEYHTNHSVQEAISGSHTTGAEKISPQS